ncbi:MFS transporter [Paenibacillus silviterrae]|uniref:MFS transporter n=1 Tax=Paenibacillus silviterrae TaxID=3242194 RepID=UPI002543B235|nr:MFS transporter [Paenibacillus chinjuensis]
MVFSFQVMLNITRPLIPLLSSDMGAGMADIGLLTATYAFFPLVLAIHIGKIADYVGDRLPVILGTVGITIGVGIPFFVTEMWALYVSQAIVGVSQIFINVSLQNVIGNAATKENRDHYFSMFSMSVALGGVVGPVLGGYLGEHVSYPFAFAVAFGLGLIPIAFSFFIPKLERKKQTTGTASNVMQGSVFSLLTIPLLRKALFSSALVLYSRDIFVAYFPLYGEELGLSASVIGWIITVQGIAMVLVRLFLSRLTDRVGRSNVLLISILMAGAAFVLVPVFGQVPLLMLISALMGFGLGCGQPLSMTTTYNASPKSRTGEVLGLRLATNRLSQMAAPLLFGALGSWAGLVAIFYISGLCLIGGAVLTRSGNDELYQEERT